MWRALAEARLSVLLLMLLKGFVPEIGYKPCWFGYLAEHTDPDAGGRFVVPLFIYFAVYGSMLASLSFPAAAISAIPSRLGWGLAAARAATGLGVVPALHHLQVLIPSGQSSPRAGYHGHGEPRQHPAAIARWRSWAHNRARRHIAPKPHQQVMCSATGPLACSSRLSDLDPPRQHQTDLDGTESKVAGRRLR